MKKTLSILIMSVVITLMMFVNVFAFTDEQQINIVGVLDANGFSNRVFQLEVPADIKLKNSTDSDYTDGLSVLYTGEELSIDGKATLDMSIVRDAFDTLTGAVENLFSVNYPDEAADLNSQFDSMLVQGEITVTIAVSDGMTIPAAIETGDGFSNNVSLFFDKVDTIVEENEVTIIFEVKDGLTKGQLDANINSLDDFSLICEGFKVTDVAEYGLFGSVEGSIRVVAPESYEVTHTIVINAVDEDGNQGVSETVSVTEEMTAQLMSLAAVEDAIVTYQDGVQTENSIELQDLSSAENYTVTLDIQGVTTTTAEFPKYADGETPYAVERIIPMAGYTGAITDIKINGTSIDYYVENGVVKANTDLINADGITITVVTSDDARLRSWIGKGESTATGSFTVNGKVDQIISNEFGVLVSKNGQYDNIVNSTEFTGTWDDTVALAFKAPSKNKNGIFAMQFTQLDPGTYYFGVYTKSATGMRYDIRDANDEFVIYTFGDSTPPYRPSTSGGAKPVVEEPELIIVVDGEEKDVSELIVNNKVDVADIETPEKEGFAFEGWYDGTEKVEGEVTIKNGETLKLYAKFVSVQVPDKFETSDEHYAYIIGYPDGTVRPNDNISREEIATIFYRLLTDEYRNEILSTTNDFEDVEEGRWSNKAISTMANGGYIQGYDGKFNPEDAITRAEFVTIAARFLETESEAEAEFKDVEGHWAEEYIDATSQAAWINGYEDNTFKPDNNITRAEAMAIFNRILCRRVDSDGLIQGTVYFPDVNDTDWFVYDVLEATNSHKCEKADGEVYEDWTELLPNRDWTKY